MVSYPETSVDPVKPYIKTRGGYTWEFLVGVCHRYIDYNANQKDFLKSVRNLHISLLVSYSFGIETIICLYSPVVSSKTILDPKPKWAKSIPVFRPKRRKNHTLLGGTDLYGLYKGVSPGHKKGFTIRGCGGRRHPCMSLLQREGNLSTT